MTRGPDRGGPTGARRLDRGPARRLDPHGCGPIPVRKADGMLGWPPAREPRTPRRVSSSRSRSAAGASDGARSLPAVDKDDAPSVRSMSPVRRPVNVGGWSARWRPRHPRFHIEPAIDAMLRRGILVATALFCLACGRSAPAPVPPTEDAARIACDRFAARAIQAADGDAAAELADHATRCYRALAPEAG
jgi:hypothetical protein